MHSIAFVTTCKGRLHHLKQTLPSLVAESPAEIILVDYACPDHAGDWVEAHFPSVKVVRVSDDPGFCLPRARNIGAANSSAPWLCFIDADIQVKRGWLAWLNRHVQEPVYYRAAPVNGKRDRETFGTVVCSRNAFNAVGGYDEAFRGWGGEDSDLYLRLAQSANVLSEHYPGEFVSPISHANDERTTFHAIKNIQTQRLINTCYIKAKAHLHAQGVANIPLATRQQMMAGIAGKLGPAQPTTFAIRVAANQLTTADGRSASMTVEVARRRRFGFFGARKTTVRILSQSVPTTPGVDA
jgi:glycosyltransferase involved in cell wall biosynthesis